MMFYLDLVVTTLTDDVDRYLKYETGDEARVTLSRKLLLWRSLMPTV